MKFFLVAAFAALFVQPTFASSSVSFDEAIILAKATPEELVIEVAGDVTGVVNVSIFSQLGEIVMTKELRAGANSISVKYLRTGSYTAVVRENDTFKQKLEFQVN